ncbi:unnamed protein product [Clavelina lepadiformis]|uniref:Ubiquitin-like domain-containing protein n=1 Tax=Clavelina lepadiformis TaxID=159417 RepID=A0ABP0EWZ2_CLALP
MIMLEEISEFLLQGNNEILALLLTVCLCIIPLILAWRSTAVTPRPYNQYISRPSAQAGSNSNTFSPDVGNNVIFQTATNHLAASLNVEPSENNGGSNTNHDTSGVTTSDRGRSYDSAEPSISAPSEPPNADDTSNENTQETTSCQLSQEQIPSADEDVAASAPGQYFLRLKFLDDTIKVIQVRSTETVGEIRRKAFPAETSDRYRIIYRGQVLRNTSQTLEQCGISFDQSAQDRNADNLPVLHCFLSANTDDQNRPSNASSQLQNTIDELSIGHFFLPFLGSILIMLWYLCIYHTSLFTIPSIFGVIGLTCFYFVLVVNRFL